MKSKSPSCLTIGNRLERLWHPKVAPLTRHRVRSALVELAYDKQAGRIAYVDAEEAPQGEEARLELSAVYHWLRRDIRRPVVRTSAKCERQTPN